MERCIGNNSSAFEICLCQLLQRVTTNCFLACQACICLVSQLSFLLFLLYFFCSLQLMSSWLLTSYLLSYSWHYGYPNIDGGNFHFLALFLIPASAFVSAVNSAVLVKAKALHWCSRLIQLCSITGLSLLPFASTQHPFPVFLFFLLHKDFSTTPW